MEKAKFSYFLSESLMKHCAGKLAYVGANIQVRVAKIGTKGEIQKWSQKIFPYHS